MARPKSTDPREMIGLRIRRSALGWWADKGENEGLSVAQLLQRVIEERAQREMASDPPVPTESLEAPKEPPKAGVPTMNLLESGTARQVTPMFKKGKQ